MINFLKNRFYSDYRFLFFLIILILSTVFARGISYTASYFSGHATLQNLSAILVFNLFFLGGFILSFKHIPFKPWILSGFASSLVLLSNSIHFLYAYRPYTLYLSVWIFSLLVFWAGVSAIFSSQILLMLRSIHSSYSIRYIFVTLIISILIIALPSIYPWRIVPILISFGIIGSLILAILKSKWGLRILFIPGIFFIIQLLVYTQLPFLYFDENQKYFEDKVIYSTSTQKFEVVMTQWMDDYWLFLNQLKNLSSIDEYLYYEPFAHTPLLIRSAEHVLVLGGENGCLIRELLKYGELTRIDLVPYDPQLLSFCATNPLMKEINNGSLSNKKINLIASSLPTFITQSGNLYDVIFVDLPDPRNLETNQFYTVEFYSYLAELLPDKGIFITQAGSPYFATKAYLAIEKTIQEAEFNTLPIHNQVITLGEWGWIIGFREEDPSEVKNQLLQGDDPPVNTRWMDRGALHLITSFGKNYVAVDTIKKNTIENPVVYQYFLEGNWILD